MTAQLGLDLGARELRLLEIDGRRLLRHTEMMLPEGAMVDGMPGPLLTAVIRAALQDEQYASTSVQVAIAETGTAFRDFRLPRLPASELANAVAFEGRRLIPMDAGDLYFAWHAQRAGKGYDVYLVAARRAMIDAVVATLEAAGLQVERIDLKPLALARGLGVADGLLVDWGAAEATVVLMAAGRPRFLRTFQLDASPDDPEAQLTELMLSLTALVKFMRGAAPEVAIGPTTSLALGGRFAFIGESPSQLEERLQFKVLMPVTRFQADEDFPWQAHFTELGLLQQERWRPRLTPSQGGDIRVAA